MTRGTLSSDADSELLETTSAAAGPIIMTNDAARIAGNQSEQQQQTPSAASAASRGGEKDPSEPQESELKDSISSLHHATETFADKVIDETPSTGSSKEVQGEGKQDDKTEVGKGETNNEHSAEEIMGDDAESVGENQNSRENAGHQQTEVVLIGERETILSEPTKDEGYTDESIESGKRGKNDQRTDDHIIMSDAERVLRQNQDLPEGVVQPALKSTETVKEAEGQTEDTRETGEGEGNDVQSADDKTTGDAESVRGNQERPDGNAHQQQVRMRERKDSIRSSATVKCEGQEDNKVETGNREANHPSAEVTGTNETISADDHIMSDAERVFRQNQNLPEGVVQPDLLMGERETINNSTEKVKEAEGQKEDTRETGEGEGNDQSTDVKNTSDVESVRGNQERPGNVHQQQVRMREREDSRSSATVKDEGQEDNKVETGNREADHPSAGVTGTNETAIRVREQGQSKGVLEGGARGTKTSESSGDANQENDRVETRQGETNDQSAQPSTSDADCVNNQNQKQSESVKQKQVLKGDLGTKPSEYGSTKQRLKRRYEQDRKEGKANMEKSKKSDVPSVDVESVTGQVSEVEGANNGRITEGEAKSGESNAKPKATGPGTARKQTSSDGRERKRPRDSLQLPSRLAARRDVRPLDVDPNEAAAMAHSDTQIERQTQEYRLEMATRNLLMRSTPPSYMTGLGLPPPPPYYYPYYQPGYPMPYVPPNMGHPLPHHHLHHSHPHPHPHPHASLPYELERDHQLRVHGAAAQLPLQPHLLPSGVEALRAVAGSRHPGSSTMMPDAAHWSYSQAEEAKADSMRTVPTSRSRPSALEAEEATLRAAGGSRRLDPSIRSVPTMSDAIHIIQPPTLAAGLGAAGLTPRTSGAVLGVPQWMATQEHAPVTVAAAPVASRAGITEKEPPEIDPSSMDAGTLAKVRRQRKNAQSRIRAAKFRLRLDEIQAKPPNLRTEEELHILKVHEEKRQKKNSRSRNRAGDRKKEIDRILSMPKEARTADDIKFLEVFSEQKKRKIEGDRLRRSRMKHLGFAAHERAPGITARGPLPPEYQQALQLEQSEEHPEDAQPEESLGDEA